MKMGYHDCALDVMIFVSFMRMSFVALGVIWHV